MKLITTILVGILLISCHRGGEDSSSKSTDQEKQVEVKLTENDSLNNKEAKNYLTNLQIDSLTRTYDRLIEEKALTKYFHPNMSRCGGGIDGYYQDSTLLIIDATYQAELGFSSKKIYWNKDDIVKITYREYFAEWGKYEEKYPSGKHEWDPGKMTYTDTVYQMTLGKEYHMQKMADEKLISEQLDSVLVKRLIDCGFEMKNELETEKKLKK